MTSKLYIPPLQAPSLPLMDAFTIWVDRYNDHLDFGKTYND